MALSGQRIVIIGGSSGMGGHGPRRSGGRSGSHDRIQRPGALKAALAELPGTCDGAVVNTRDEANVTALFARVGELDHVVYTAGDTVRPQPLADLPLDAARELFEVRFWGAVAAVKHAAPRVRPGGSIVLTSGTVAVRRESCLHHSRTGAGPGSGSARRRPRAWAAPAPYPADRARG